MNFKKILAFKNHILIALLILLALSPSVFFFIKYRESEQKLKTLNSPLDQNTKIIAEVGKLIKLPEGETPTVATVTDREKLSGQPFFQNAKNGDVVIIYSNAKKAILYDPQAHKIIDVAPLSVTTPTPTPAGPTPTIKPVSLILLNGTTQTGLTRKYETEIKENLQTVTVASRDNAKKRDYQTTLLIDINNDQQDEAKKLSDKLKITLSPLPEGESASASADFLIIVGADKI